MANFFTLVSQGWKTYDGEFLSPEEIAIREQEKARKASELQAAQEAAISYSPAGLTEVRENVEAYKTSEQLAAEAAEQEAKQKQAIEQTIAEQGDIYASTVGTGGSFAEEQEERREREEIYFNEQRTGMGSQDYLGDQVFTASPDRIVLDDSLKLTSYFDEDNQAKGDPRLYDEIKEDFLSGETSGPQDINIYIGEQEKYKNLIYDFDYGEAYSELSPAEQRLARTDGTIDYSRPADFQDAKDSADSYYVQSLERSLENATTDEEKESIQKLIDNGSPNFDTLEDLQNYDDLYANHRFESENGFDLKHEEYKALALQEAVMGDYMIGEQREDLGDKATTFFKEPEDLPSWGGFEAFKEGDVYFNTGTAFNRIPSSNLIEEDGTVGQVGGYNYIKPEMRELPSGIRNIGYALDVVSIFVPPLAPAAQGMKALSQTEDVEEAFEVAGKTYVKGKVNDVTKEHILDTYEALDIPVRELDQYTQSKIVDVTNDVLAGKSGTESAEDATKSIIWKNIKDEVGYSFEEFESKFDLSLPDFGLPDIDLPDIDLPDIDLPDLPDFDLPDIDIPDIDLPDIDLPDIDLPDVDLPDIDLPDVDLNLPDVPDLNVDLDLPDLDLDLSGIETPEFDFDLDLEGLDIEGPDIEMPETPDVDIDLPSLNLRKQEREEKESEVEEMFLPELFRHDTQVKYTQGLLAPKINLRKF